MRIKRTTELTEGMRICHHKMQVGHPAYWEGTIALDPSPQKHYVSNVAYQKERDRHQGINADWYIDVRFANGRIEDKMISVARFIETQQQEVAA